MAATIVLEVSPSDATTARTILDAAKAALPDDTRISIVRVYEE